MTTREVVLIVHIFFTALSLGPLSLAMSLFPRGLEAALAGEGLSSAQLLARTTRRYGRTLLVVPVTGLWLAHNIDAFGQLWVRLALGITVAILAILHVVVVPAQQRLLLAATVQLPAAAVAGSSIWTSPRRTTAELGAQVRRLEGFAAVAAGTMAINLGWATVLGLMVVKPR